MRSIAAAAGSTSYGTWPVTIRVRAVVEQLVARKQSFFGNERRMIGKYQLYAPTHTASASAARRSCRTGLRQRVGLSQRSL